ncbi:MAG: tyrosine-type recombinase/integrase [Rhodospirillales bacterium]|nr:tyrosine-type recombinase/integrase [Rhodospirillales bacterium]
MLKSHDELIAEFAQVLTAQSYNLVVVANHQLYARAFLDYLAERDLPVATVTPSQVDQYFRHAVQRFRVRYGREPSSRWHRLPHTAICKLLRLAQGTWPPEPEISDPVAARRHAICHEYENWMRDERGLADETIDARMREARRFLEWYFGRSGADGLPALEVREIDIYMDMRAQGLRRTSHASSAAWLRSLLRYLHQAGRIPTDLSPQVIGPMLYAYEDIPPTLDRSQIDTVLAATSKDGSPRGLRDYAILQLLAIYGLREGEICKLRLDDIDWRADFLRIRHTKTDACSYMPLLAPVGDALLDYLRVGRPQVDRREVFIRSLAPYTQMKNLYGMVEGRLAAAGITPLGKRGPHVFRHARAVELLRAAVPQKIIGDVLGHRSTKSTNAYLKLATEDLRAVALDVPESAVLS